MIWAKNFLIVKDKNLNSINSQKNLLLSVKVNDKIHCMGECLKNTLCNLIVVTKYMICNVYVNQIPNNNILVDSIGTNIFTVDLSQYTFLSNLVYYWPFNSYNGLKDVISGISLTGSGSISDTTNRFNNPSSAIYLNKGWLTGSSRIYLKKSFTLTFWIRIRETICSILFASTQLTFYNCWNIKILINNGGPVLANSNTTLTLDKWQLLTFTMNENTSIFSTYINGDCIYQGIQNFTQYLDITTGSIFGYSYGWPLNGELSDFQIYNRTLSQSEIKLLGNIF